MLVLETDDLSSSGEGSHLSALTEPDGTLSRHPALTPQPPVARLVPTRQIAWGPAARCVPASASTLVLGDSVCERVQRIVLATPGTEPITKTQELRLVDWREDCDHCGLDNFIF